MQLNGAAIVSLAASAWLSIGSLLLLVGVMPRRLSPREAGFDMLEYVVELAVALLVIWPSAAVARPKRHVLAAAVASLLPFGLACLLADLVVQIRRGR